jgi:hypothetical protein
MASLGNHSPEQYIPIPDMEPDYGENNPEIQHTDPQADLAAAAIAQRAGI